MTPNPPRTFLTRRAVLLAVVVAELVVGGVLLYWKRSKPVPPVPDLSAVDPLVAAHIRERAATCRTPDDWAELGEVYLAYGYFPEGEACYREAYYRGEEGLQIGPRRHPPRADRLYELGFALERIGQQEDANGAYERAIGFGYPHPADCWYYIGRNHLRMGQVVQARHAFEQAGDQPSARYELARLKAKAGDDAGAIAIIDTLAAEYPTAVQPPLLRHRIEILRDSPAAAVYADRADRFQRDRLPTPFDRDWDRLENRYFSIGLAHEWREARKLMEAGKTADAEKRVRDALAVQWSPEGADLLAEIETRRVRPAEAARLLLEIIDRAGPSAPLLDALGDAYQESGKPDPAVTAWLRATDLGIGAAVKLPLHKLATHYEKAGDAATARRYFGRAYLAAGHAEFWGGKLADAQLLMEHATDSDPRLVPAWFYLGEVHRLSNRPDEARKAYRKCLDLDPDYGRAIRGLALLDLK